MEEDVVLVCRESKISMQEGREVEGKSVIRISLLNYYYLRTSQMTHQAREEHLCPPLPLPPPP